MGTVRKYPQYNKFWKKEKNTEMSLWIGLGCLSLASSSYVPPYYEGNPTLASVVSLDPPDFRGQDVYRIEFNLNAKAGMPQDGFVHRSWEDFQQFNSMMSTNHPFIFGLDFPSEPSLESLNGYISRVMSHVEDIAASIIAPHDLDDFLGINWSGSDLKFMESLEEFMKVVIPQAYRAPEFAPEPPVFDNERDAISAEETPFETYAYLKGFRSQSSFAEYQKFFAKFTDTYPDFPGLPDDSDVQPEGFPCDITNVQFYHANAEEMSWLESETFDFINYAYVLHEMPADNAIRVVDEMYRLLKAGGTMNGFEVPFVDNLAARETYVLFNTWGHSWQEQGAQGPEPYMEEYEFGVQLTNALATAGFNNVEFIDYSYFEGIFLATK